MQLNFGDGRFKWSSSGGLRVAAGGRSRWHLVIIFLEDKVDRCWPGDDIVRVSDRSIVDNKDIS